MNDMIPADAADQLGNLVQHFPAQTKRLRTLALLSSNRGEGTSTCTVNLAKFIAGNWSSRVLMVDANLRHPALHELAGVERECGLAEYLSENRDLDAVVKRTSVATLFVVTAGSDEPRFHRPLESKAFQERLIPETSSFDFVLFDLPPVNLYLDATNVARLCDGVILVVEGEKTRRQVAQSAKAQLSRADCTILGVFMNKRKFYIPKLIYDRI